MPKPKVAIELSIQSKVIFTHQGSGFKEQLTFVMLITEKNANLRCVLEHNTRPISIPDITRDVGRNVWSRGSAKSLAVSSTLEIAEGILQFSPFKSH